MINSHIASSMTVTPRFGWGGLNPVKPDEVKENAKILIKKDDIEWKPYEQVKDKVLTKSIFKGINPAHIDYRQIDYPIFKPEAKERIVHQLEEKLYRGFETDPETPDLTRPGLAFLVTPWDQIQEEKNTTPDGERLINARVLKADLLNALSDDEEKKFRHPNVSHHFDWDHRLQGRTNQDEKNRLRHQRLPVYDTSARLQATIVGPLKGFQGLDVQKTDGGYLNAGTVYYDAQQYLHDHPQTKPAQLMGDLGLKYDPEGRVRENMDASPNKRVLADLEANYSLEFDPIEDAQNKITIEFKNNDIRPIEKGHGLLNSLSQLTLDPKTDLDLSAQLKDSSFRGVSHNRVTGDRDTWLKDVMNWMINAPSVASRNSTEASSKLDAKG